MSVEATGAHRALWDVAPLACDEVDLSIVIPVRDEASSIRPLIEGIYALDPRGVRFEVIVVDGLSRDRTAAIVCEMQGSYPDLRLYANPRRLSSAARNIGVEQARGELVAIVDGHCTIDNAAYLPDLVDAFRRSGADCLGRPQPQESPGATPLQRAIAEARSSWLGHHPASFVYSDGEQFVPPQSVAVAYRRSVFERVGQFDESFDACEDVEFNHRVAREGLSCYFSPRLRVLYHPRTSLSALFRQMVRYGRGRVRLLRKHPETASAGSLAPGAFLAGLLTGPWLAWRSPWLAVFYLGSMALYALMVTAASLAIARRLREPRLLTWLPLVFAAIHLGAGWGVLREAIAIARTGRGRMPT